MLTFTEDVLCRINSVDSTGTPVDFNITITIQDPQFREIIFIDPVALESPAGTVTESTDPGCNGTLNDQNTITFTFMTSDIGSKCFISFEDASNTVLLHSIVIALVTVLLSTSKFYFYNFLFTYV